MLKTRWMANLQIKKMYFESNRGNLRFQKEKTYSKNTPCTAGSILKRQRVFLVITTGEGVRADLSHWIKTGSPRLEGGKG